MNAASTKKILESTLGSHPVLQLETEVGEEWAPGAKALPPAHGEALGRFRNTLNYTPDLHIYPVWEEDPESSSNF